jgi:transcriptional regulator with XRE-family HTH domain
MGNRLDVLMLDKALRQAFGTRVKQLRKEHGWSQKQLAGQLDIRFQLLNKYEGGQHIPPAETLIKLADVLGTTVDFLLTGNPEQELPNVDDSLFRRFQVLERFNDEDKQTVIRLIDAMIAKQRMTSALAPVDMPQ